MIGPWPVTPGVPAAGHVARNGAWHPGRIDGCAKCPAPEVPGTGGWQMTGIGGSSWRHRDGRRSTEPTPWSEELRRYLTPDEHGTASRPPRA